VAEGFEPSDDAAQLRHPTQFRGLYHTSTEATGHRLDTLWAHFKSIEAATASRSESNKSLQTSNVTLADWCPSIRLRANTFTPEVIAMLAHGLCPVHT
jgi:hypothetical protein